MLWRSFIHSFFSRRSPAYSGLQRVDRQQAQCTCPWERGGELIGVCSVWATCRRGGFSRHEQLVRYLLMRPVKVWLTVWLAWLELMQPQPTSTYAVLAPADVYAALPEASHIFLHGPRRHSRPTSAKPTSWRPLASAIWKTCHRPLGHNSAKIWPIFEIH